jgi:hypothetical protein
MGVEVDACPVGKLTERLATGKYNVVVATTLNAADRKTLADFMAKGGGVLVCNPGNPADMKEWLSYIASDQLQGRQVYAEGLGLAASYIADHLKAWGVKPGGDDGSYFQVVKVLGVNVKRNSTVTVTVNGQSKTFKPAGAAAATKGMDATR